MNLEDTTTSNVEGENKKPCVVIEDIEYTDMASLVQDEMRGVILMGTR